MSRLEKPGCEHRRLFVLISKSVRPFSKGVNTMFVRGLIRGVNRGPLPGVTESVTTDSFKVNFLSGLIV